MTIKFPCPHCKKGLSVKEHLAGKKAHCPACKKELVIPQPQPEPADVEALAAAALADPAEQKAEPQTIDFTCPQCDEQISVGAELSGKNTQCPACRRIIKVPVVKTKEDWRAKDHLPSGARRDTEPAPEGAWAPTRTVASREALEEAGAVKADTRKGLSTRQKVTRGVLVGAVALLTFVGVALGLGIWRQSEQADLVKRAVALADPKTAKNRELAAEVHRAAGEFYLRSGELECADKAKKFFDQARNLLAVPGGGPEHDLLLIDLALSEVDMLGRDEDVQEGKRLPAEKVATGLRQTLGNLNSSEARFHGLRVIADKLLRQGAEATIIVNLAGRLAQALGTAPIGGDTLPYEAPELLGIAGLELLKADRKPEAEKMLTLALNHYPAANPPPANPRPPLAPSVVALAVALGKAEPPPGKAREDGDYQLIGRAEGLARLGKLDAARNISPTAPAEVRLRALVAVAAATGEVADVDQAITLLQAERGQAPSWLVYRLALLAAQAGQQERAEALAAVVSHPGLRARAQVDVLRWRLSRSDGRADEALAAKVDKQQMLALALTYEALARHNVRHDGGLLKAVEGWDEPLRPFGLIGAALGRQDR